VYWYKFLIVRCGGRAANSSYHCIGNIDMVVSGDIQVLKLSPRMPRTAATCHSSGTGRATRRGATVAGRCICCVWRKPAQAFRASRILPATATIAVAHYWAAAAADASCSCALLCDCALSSSTPVQRVGQSCNACNRCSSAARADLCATTSTTRCSHARPAGRARARSTPSHPHPAHCDPRALQRQRPKEAI
jgi:hypothetical protein